MYPKPPNIASISATKLVINYIVVPFIIVLVRFCLLERSALVVLFFRRLQ